MQQTTHTILMIRPVNFRMNEQTTVNNYYQQSLKNMLPAAINAKAQQEFDNFVGKLKEKGKEEIEKELIHLAQNKAYDITLAAITDVTQHVSMIIAVGDKRIIQALPFEHEADGVIIANGVVSRKKQILPAVCDAIHRASATMIE